MKTLITVPGNNFQTYNAIPNSNDELEIVGQDGNGVAFQQTLAVPPGSVIFFDVNTKNFTALPLNTEINPSWQFVSVVREIA